MRNPLDDVDAALRSIASRPVAMFSLIPPKRTRAVQPGVNQSVDGDH